MTHPRMESRRGTDDRGTESLGELLAARARRATDGRLALDVAVGLLTLAGAIAWRPPGWLAITCVALGLFAFGTWGITDRERAEHAVGSRAAQACRLVQAGAVLLGAIALGGFALTLLFGVLGNWIS